MRLKEIEKLKKKELKKRVDEAFEKADEKGPAYLMEAQFYIRELEHRHDSWVSIRDLLLEIAVILLIGWEIWMGYRAEGLQTKNFKVEKEVFDNLNASSSATANTLVAVNGTMEAMKLSLEKQVALFYDVQVNVIYNEGTKKLILINDSRSNVTVWAHRVGVESAPMETYLKPVVITPSGTFEFGFDEYAKQISGQLPKGASQTFRFTFFLKNEKHERFTLSGDLIAAWHGDVFYFLSQSQGTTPGWNK
jgi:hypothetical protein